MTDGILELTYVDNVRLIIQAPAVFELERQDRVELSSGRLAARVPTNAIGFTVRTGRTEVVDLGTEFVVDVPNAVGADIPVRTICPQDDPAAVAHGNVWRAITAADVANVTT